MESFIIDVGTDSEIWNYVIKLTREYGISSLGLDVRGGFTATPASFRYLPGDNRLISASTDYYLQELPNVRRVPVIELRKYLEGLKIPKRLVINTIRFKIEPGKYIKANCTTLTPNQIKDIMTIYAPDAALQCPTEDSHLSSTTRC